MLVEHTVPELDCQHCVWMSSRGIFHKKTCNCGHHHSKHNFCGGCTVKGCKCDVYDQSERKIAIVQPKEPAIFAVPEIDLTALEEQTEAKSELAEAQARLDVLRKKKEELLARN